MVPTSVAVVDKIIKDSNCVKSPRGVLLVALDVRTEFKLAPPRLKFSVVFYTGKAGLSKTASSWRTRILFRHCDGLKWGLHQLRLLDVDYLL